MAGQYEPFKFSFEKLKSTFQQVVAAGEDDTVVFRQHHTRVAQRVDPLHRLVSCVVDQMAPHLLPVGENLQENEFFGVVIKDFGVVKSLVGLLYRFAVNPQSVFGVVLNFDREIAPHTLNKDLIGYVDMGVGTRGVIFSSGFHPLKVVAGRVDDLALIPVKLNALIAGLKPFQHLAIRFVFAGLEAG